MKLTVKTLKGGKFEVQAEEGNTVEQVKGIISNQKPELPAANMKLIHSGRVLKDGDAIGSCGIKPNDFLVVMVTKPKKPAAAATTSAPAPAATAETSSAPASAPDSSSSPAPAAAAASSSSTSASTPAPAAAAATSGSQPAAPSRTDNEFPAEVIGNLTSMGFPEAEVKHCLRAAHGNPDIAVEFLTNGIPDGVAQAAAAVGGGAGVSPAAAPASGGGASGQPLQALRNHPQFDALRRLVQTNPQMLQQVLAQIGQQQPELLNEINANQALFLQMMNEPISETSAPGSSGGGGTGSGSGGAGPPGLESVGGPMGSPAQMAQMIQGMSEQELGQMAAMMGIQPDQLRQTAQMIGNMPPEQLQQFMVQAMGGGGEGGIPPGFLGMGMGGSPGGGAGAPHVLRLSDEEMAAVDRLTEMGFDRAEAAQAFLACDKNEALAANLLMDSMGDGGGAFFGGGGGGSGGGDGGGNNSSSGGGDGSGSGSNSNNSGGGGGDAADDSDEMYD